MDTCLGGMRPGPVPGPVPVDDIKRDLLGEFSALSKEDEVTSQSENLQVYLRVRPFTGAEGESQECCLAIEGPNTVVLKAPGNKSLPQTAQRFTFTQVFGPDAGQRRVFEGSVRALVRDVLHGQNALVFTYGVTNAGKTFTLLGPEHDGGLLPRCLRLIFDSAEGRLYAGGDLKPHRCRDFSRLTPERQKAESALKKSLLGTVQENDKSGTSARWTSLDASSLSSDGGAGSDRFFPDVPADVRFSVWVSYCEIYNDNIHDLLEQVTPVRVRVPDGLTGRIPRLQVPCGNGKRTALRLSQDVKGNPFIKDVKWIQVSGSEEAFKIVKIGRKNQSLASTRLNRQSSRSHSIFSVRILRVDSSAAEGRFLGVGELALCDLAGSERCSRTRNTGERLKEAGNINGSLLALGKCIGAMRLKRNAGRRDNRFPHHVPFRESKLTHFLQQFLSGGAGKVSMVVNVNQDASCADETLNVLKFSALAQKVTVSYPKPAGPDRAAVRSAAEVSVLIDEADRRGAASARGRKTSSASWETSLEDLAENDEEETEATVLGADEDDDVLFPAAERPTDRAAARLVLEAQIREEVCAQFTEIFHKMEKDYRERLERERDILEERANARLEILKNLLGAEKSRAAQTAESAIGSVGEDPKSREDAESARRQLLLADQDQDEKERLDAEVKRLREDNLEKDDAISRLREEVRLLTGKTAPTAGTGRRLQFPFAASPGVEKEDERATGDDPTLADQILELQMQVRSLQSKLRQEAEGAAVAPRRPDDGRPDAFRANMARVREEWEADAESSARKSRIIREITQEKLASDQRCERLAEELAEREADYSRRLEELRAELRRRDRTEPDRRREPEHLEEKAETPAEESEKPHVTPDASRSKTAGGKRKSSQVEGLSSSSAKRKKPADVTGAARVRRAADRSASFAAPSFFQIPEAPYQVPAPRSKSRRGRRKLYGKETAAPLAISPDATCATGGAEQKESDHTIIKRKLRSKAARM
ncbi:kinesin-like protein KIF20B isoform X3 [Corythoichthys intestinalis]|uniref:kinesin-like protein KIF20B isoform X3 n=1 Tax=Corythoichthys intestinalis TaxID=161448 RepID=UPI0025A63AB3|nr:kinesin-like protein KIF20B isoform X3 [Corythoichthys intestinalis]